MEPSRKQILNDILSNGVSIVAVQDVWVDSVDNQTKKLTGSLDMRTDLFNPTWSEAPFKTRWICRHNNFFMGETKSSYYVDENGNRLKLNYLTLVDKLSDLVESDPNHFLINDRLIKRKYIHPIPGIDHSKMKKIREFGFTLSKETAKQCEIDHKPNERFFNVFRVVKEGTPQEGKDLSWEEEPHVYAKNPQDLNDFEEFCRKFNVTRVIQRPVSQKKKQAGSSI